MLSKNKELKVKDIELTGTNRTFFIETNLGDFIVTEMFLTNPGAYEYEVLQDNGEKPAEEIKKILIEATMDYMRQR